MLAAHKIIAAIFFGIGSTASAQSEEATSTSNAMSPATPEVLQANTQREAKYSAKLGLSVPDLLHIAAGYDLSTRVQIAFGLSPGFPYPVTIVAPPDEEVIKTRLKAGTPKTDYETKIRYRRNVFVNLSWRPSESTKWYVMGGIGYRKMHVTTEGNAELFVCLVTPEVPCNKENETFPSRSTINLTADIETVSHNLRGATGWKFEWDNHVYIDWTILGLVYTRSYSKSITVRSKLETEQTEPEAQEVLKEMESYLTKKEDSIRSRVVRNVEKVDALPLPYMGLAIGYNF